MSYVLILLSIIFSVTVSSSSSKSSVDSVLNLLASPCRLVGIGIFSIMIMMTIRTSPKLLRLVDYFIALSVFLFVILAFADILNYDNMTQNIQLWIMFPIIMIFGIQYKTLPSFIGFIWPRKIGSIMSAVFLTLSSGLGIASSYYHDTLILEFISRIVLLAGVACFTWGTKHLCRF